MKRHFFPKLILAVLFLSLASCQFEESCFFFRKCFDGLSNTYTSSDPYGSDQCYCKCDADSCGFDCEFKKSDCKGTVVESTAVEGRCYCRCPILPGYPLRAPECDASDIFFKFLDSKKSTRFSTTDYFPVTEGNSWSYNFLDSMGNITGDFQNTIEGSFFRGDTLINPVRISFPDSSGTRRDTIAGLMFAKLPGDSTTIYSRENDGSYSIFLRHVLMDGDTLISDGDSLFIKDHGTVSVPAGTFDNCLSALGPDSTGFILAPDLGIVQIIGENGLVSSELTEYELFCSFSLEVSRINAGCFGEANGQLLLKLIGQGQNVTSLEDLDFNWSGPATINDPTSPDNLVSGFYNVTVTNGFCEAVVDSIFIDSSPPVVISIIDIQNTSCPDSNNGSASLQFSGGTGPLSVSLDGAPLMNGDLDNLSVGSYEIIARDSLGCMTSIILLIDSPDAISSNPISTDVSCNSLQNGSIISDISGGTPPYSYLWENGSQEANLTDLDAGTYQLIVSDRNDCLTSFQYTINEPEPLTASASISFVSCFNGSDGSLELHVEGGTPPYSFAWSNNSTQEDLDGIAAGVYSLTLTDDNNCIEEYSFIVQEPSNLVLGALVNDTSCPDIDDGLISLEASGGTPPYSYIWSNSETVPDLNNLSEGLYSVTVNDSNQCTAELEVIISEPADLQIDLNSKDANCLESSDGSVEINASGGTPPYMFLINDQAIENWNLDSLSTGSYTVKMIDNNSCESQEDFVISESNPVDIFIEDIDARCYGEMSGSAELFISGGTPPFTIQWSTGSDEQILSELSQGSYEVTVLDSNNCSDIGFGIVEQPDSLQLLTESTNAVGSNSNGIANVEVSGGVPPYRYLWDDPDMQTSATAFDLAAGLYTVIVTDANDCEAIASVEVLMTSSLQEIEGTGRIQIYPNPASEFINIKTSDNRTIRSILVYDISGSLVLNSDHISCSECQLDLIALRKGIYLMKIYDLNNKMKELLFIKI